MAQLAAGMVLGALAVGVLAAALWCIYTERRYPELRDRLLFETEEEKAV